MSIQRLSASAKPVLLVCWHPVAPFPTVYVEAPVPETLVAGLGAMHFRIPHALNGFEASAVASGIASQQAFTNASTGEHLRTLQAQLGQLQARSRYHHNHTVLWSEEVCAEVYSMLCTVAEAGWPSAALLRLLARFLSANGPGASVVKGTTTADPEDDDSPAATSDGLPAEAALGLTIFFTCQMLQHTEVGNVVYPKLLSVLLVMHHGCS